MSPRKAPNDDATYAASSGPSRTRLAFTRLVVTAVAAVAGGALAVVFRSGPDETLFVILLGYVSGAAAYLVMVGRILLRTPAHEIPRHAMAEDPGRNTVLLFILGSSAAVVGGALTLLKGMGGDQRSKELLLVLTLAGTALAWLVTNAAFALHYAHLNFRDLKSVPEITATSSQVSGTGFLFPGSEQPNGVDFAYLAFTVGMTFQVSDVQVMNAACRRTVLVHGMLCFAYNTLLIAMVVNAALGQVHAGS